MKAHLNPFAPDRVQRLLPFDPALIGTSWETIESDWQNLDRRAAVIGHKGSGKTTFLRAFTKRLNTKHEVISLFFREQDRKLSESDSEQLHALKSDTILFVDGEGHLSFSARKKLRTFAKKAHGYLAARHHRSTLPTLLHLKSKPELALVLLQKMDLADASKLQERLPNLLQRKNGNLREVWLELYDEYSALDSQNFHEMRE